LRLIANEALLADLRGNDRQRDFGIRLGVSHGAMASVFNWVQKQCCGTSDVVDTPSIEWRVHFGSPD